MAPPRRASALMLRLSMLMVAALPLFLVVLVAVDGASLVVEKTSVVDADDEGKVDEEKHYEFN